MNDWVHSQYISASSEGKDVGALDLLFHYLITDHYAAKSIFDFGQSTENMGYYLNNGIDCAERGVRRQGNRV